MDIGTKVVLIILAVALGVTVISAIISACYMNNKCDAECRKLVEGPVLTRKELVQYDGRLLFPVDSWGYGGKIIRVWSEHHPGSLFIESKLLHVDDEFYEYASLMGWNSWSGRSDFRFDLVDFDDWLKERAARTSRREQLHKEFDAI